MLYYHKKQKMLVFRKVLICAFYCSNSNFICTDYSCRRISKRYTKFIIKLILISCSSMLLLLKEEMFISVYIFCIFYTLAYYLYKICITIKFIFYIFKTTIIIFYCTCKIPDSFNTWTFLVLLSCNNIISFVFYKFELWNIYLYMD